MSTRAEDFLTAALKALGPKPRDTARQAEKKRFSELVSAAVAEAFAGELRRRGLRGIRPAGPGEVGVTGAERRIAGGIGAKKVDVTWATEESGLVLGISIKTINWKDAKAGNFQKNLTNRRGDMLFEGVTLHRRFPYAVLAGFFLLDKAAAHDETGRRKSTFDNAHTQLRLFTGRDDPAGRDEQYERLYIGLLDANVFRPTCEFYVAGVSGKPVTLTRILDDVIDLVVRRNADFYETDGAGKLTPVRARRPDGAEEDSEGD